MLITPTGVEWMTKELPRKIADIEAFMAKTPKELAFVPRSADPESIFLSKSSNASYR